MPLESKQLSINADNNAPHEPQARTDSPQKKLWARSLIGELSAIDDNGAMPATDNSSAPASADTTESHGDLTATDSTTSYNLAEDLATNIARANNSKSSSSSHPHQRELHSDSHSQRRARHSLDEQQRSAAMNYAETKSTPSSSVDNSTDTATQTPPSGILSSTSSAIVVALDDSAESQAAFEYVLDNLLAENDVLVLVHVYEPFSFVNMDVNEMGYVSSDIFDALSKEHKGIAKRVMQRYVAECNRRNIKCLVKTWEGEPKSGICQIAEQTRAKFLVVGTHRRNALMRLFIGSVSDYVVHNCKRPVLVIPSNIETQQQSAQQSAEVPRRESI